MKLIRTKEDFIIARLEELIDDRKSLMDNDPEHDESYIKDYEALVDLLHFDTEENQTKRFDL